MNSSEISKKIKDLRLQKGYSQDQLAIQTGLNLRTIQRIENGETVPRGDSLQRLANALQISPDNLVNFKTKEDKNVLTMLNLSQLSFIAFPILGILIPLIIWILQKDKVKQVDELGKAILNFQVSWTLLFFLLFGASFLMATTHFSLEQLLGWQISFNLLQFIFYLYLYNIAIIIINTLLNLIDKKTFYKPALKILK